MFRFPKECPRYFPHYRLNPVTLVLTHGHVSVLQTHTGILHPWDIIILSEKEENWNTVIPVGRKDELAKWPASFKQNYWSVKLLKRHNSSGSCGHSYEVMGNRDGSPLRCHRGLQPGGESQAPVDVMGGWLQQPKALVASCTLSLGHNASRTQTSLIWGG